MRIVGRVAISEAYTVQSDGTRNCDWIAYLLLLQVESYHLLCGHVWRQLPRVCVQACPVLASNAKLLYPWPTSTRGGATSSEVKQWDNHEMYSWVWTQSGSNISGRCTWHKLVSLRPIEDAEYKFDWHEYDAFEMLIFPSNWKHVIIIVVFHVSFVYPDGVNSMPLTLVSDRCLRKRNIYFIVTVLGDLTPESVITYSKPKHCTPLAMVWSMCMKAANTNDAEHVRRVTSSREVLVHTKESLSQLLPVVE